MGMREYDSGTVLFYEDESDVKNTKKLQDQSSDNMKNIDYDIDLINQLFDPS